MTNYPPGVTDADIDGPTYCKCGAEAPAGFMAWYGICRQCWEDQRPGGDYDERVERDAT